MKAAIILSALTALAGTALGGGVEGSGMIVLDPSAESALSMVGNATVTIPARAVYVNSTSASAVRTAGNASLDCPNLYVCGGINFSGRSGCTGTITNSGVAYVDPMSGLQMPSSLNVADLGSVSITGGSHIISPGYYSGGISISGNAAVTFSPGAYMIGSGGVRFTSGTISGQGVSIVMLAGSLSIAGNFSIDLSPPTSGELSGVVICQPASNTNQMSLAGGSDFNIAGSIYAPNATVSLTGNSTLTGQGPQMGDLLIARKVAMAGTGSIKIGHPNFAAVTPPKLPLAD